MQLGEGGGDADKLVVVRFEDEEARHGGQGGAVQLLELVVAQVQSLQPICLQESYHHLAKIWQGCQI